MGARDQQTRQTLELPQTPLPVILRVTGSPATPSEVRLSEGKVVFGAGADADVVVEDDAVSRRHVELRLAPEGVTVRDLQSRNGTWHLGNRVVEMALRVGSHFEIGSTEISVSLDDVELDSMDDGDATGYRGLVGVSPPMRRLFAVLQRLEGSLVNVLVEGESGVGKELVARALHDGSSRCSAPLIVVNCGALSRELVLSELFGHRKGAFTGATDDRVGAFQAAHGGTLFLDEVGELPLDMQPALLRALESGEVKPVGDTASSVVDTRVVAATNRDLSEAIQAGTFREDLYYRLAIVKLRVPALSERPEDVAPLAQHFATISGGDPLPDELVAQLSRRRFRGNARELRNAVLAYQALGMAPESERQDGNFLEAAMRQAIDPRQSYQAQREQIDELYTRVFLEGLLELADGNQSEAARIAGLDRSYLRKLIVKHGVKR